MMGLVYGPSRYLQLPAPLWCCVDWHNRLAPILHIFVLLLIPSRNFSFISIAVFPILYAVCQPFQLSPCQEVHPQEVIKTSTGAAFKHWAPLSPMRQGPLNLVSSMGLTHQHNSGFNFMCSGSWSNASDAPTLSRNTPCMVTMSNCILNARQSHQKQMFQMM